MVVSKNFELPISSTREKYVAVMGAGYGAASRTVGSGVFVIDFNDFVDRPGRIEKMISRGSRSLVMIL